MNRKKKATFDFESLLEVAMDVIRIWAGIFK